MIGGFEASLNRRDLLLGALAASGASATIGIPTIAAAQTMHDSQPLSAASAGMAVDSVRDTILRISREVWATPELSLAEVKSSQIHLRELRAALPEPRTLTPVALCVIGSAPASASTEATTVGSIPRSRSAFSMSRSKLVVTITRMYPRRTRPATALWAAVGTFRPCSRSSSVGSM